MTKELQAVQGPHGYRVRYNGGGQLPVELSGLYTSRKEADRAIAAYIPKKRVRKTKNAYSEE